MGSYAKAYLKAGKEKSVQKKHPWIFGSAIHSVENQPNDGDTVEVYSNRGEWLARGTFSSRSNIQIRLWTWDETENIDQNLIHRRIQKAVETRENILVGGESNAYRLIFSESDSLPGLVVDRYNTTIVIQLSGWGVEKWKDEIIRTLTDVVPHSQIYERSDDEVRLMEGLPVRQQLISGSRLENPVIITENDIRYFVDVANGHKTGFYLDQRENRRIVMRYAFGRDVLDCFSYTGGMAIPCILAGAKTVECIESSNDALALLKRNCELNNIHDHQYLIHQSDVFYKLREFRDRGKRFDMVILDPPKFAPTIKFIEKASRGYKDINLLAMKLLNPGGLLATFSCSGGVDISLFQKILFGAALDAGRDVKIISRFSQGCDHPVALNFPEGFYLKGFVLQVD